MQISELQRSRMLRSAVAVVSERGYGQMTVARITGGARVSRRTFYDMFEDREDCFLAVFEDAVARVSERMVVAYEGERSWRERTRAALAALLIFFDEEPGVGSLLIVDALNAGPRVLERRAGLLARMSMLTHREAQRKGSSRHVPPLTGEGVIGAVLGVIHTRLTQNDPGSMIDLLNPLMGIVVLPYQGSAAAQRELAERVPSVSRAAVSRASSSERDPLVGLEMRVTYRTLRVLTVIAERAGTSNREIARQAGIADQGQTSKLLGRLEGLGLIHNTSPGQPTGAPNRWHLTTRGKQVQQATAISIGAPAVGVGRSAGDEHS